MIIASSPCQMAGLFAALSVRQSISGVNVSDALDIVSEQELSVWQISLHYAAIAAVVRLLPAAHMNAICSCWGFGLHKGG